eukprot:CAMPEP_0170487134 /NCGR_PEP_ID=MMETSP0208-20121228/6000_1 /TAXON_ID=197538 /ORGANISM="Strombidium inclinatum, Strain S3" /LENGTH=93 /DNA_ID=CAMNT_0010761311 /DNA_START=3 /DNA_END=284 /DNA_ORIENTATION=+
MTWKAFFNSTTTDSMADKKLTTEQAAELKKAFQVMDTNGDGFVTKDELKNLLKGLGEEVTDEVVDEMIKIADENGDGKVEFTEFVKAATNGVM